MLAEKVTSIESFATLTRSEITAQAVTSLIPPSILVILLKLIPNPRLDKLHEAYAVGYSVAKEMLEMKTKEFTDGKGTQDIMSLLSTESFLVTVIPPNLTTLSVRANASSDQASRMSEEEMVAQIM